MRFLFALPVLIIGIAFSSYTPQKRSLQEYAPPSQLIDIGGRKLHLNCSGNGSPTVISAL